MISQLSEFGATDLETAQWSAYPGVLDAGSAREALDSDESEQAELFRFNYRCNLHQ